MVQKPEKTAEYPHAGLMLPARTDHKDSFFHHPETVINWLDKLPLASPLECTKILFKTLFEMNRVKLSTEDRINTLEAMLPPIESISANLKSKYSSSPFPLAEKNKKIALLIRELFKEIVIGYKIAIATDIDSGSVNKNQHSHIIAIHRAMKYLTRVLFHSYMIYESHPAHVWHEMHLLFTYSSINKFDRIQVKNNVSGNGQTLTVKQLYIKALLLAAASPYQLRQREIEILCDAIDHLTGMAKLSIRHVHDKDNDIGFMINLHSDNPPIPAATASRQENRQFFILDTRKLLEKIQLSLTDESVQEFHGISIHLKHLLLRNWGHAPHRQYVRTRLNFDLNIAVSLNEIHKLLETDTPSDSGNNLFPGQDDSAAKPRDTLQRLSMFAAETDSDDITVLTMENFNQPDINRGTFLSSQKIEKELRIDGDGLMASDNQRIEKMTHECKTINESSGGYCVEWPKKNTPGIRVGELIGIQSTSNNVEFGLAINRWLKSLPNEHLLIGIEIISHSCLSVKVRIDQIVPKHKAATYYPGLVIQKSMNNPSFLLLPSDLFKIDQILLVKNQHGVEEKTQLTKLVESTGLFSQYEASPVATNNVPVSNE